MEEMFEASTRTLGGTQVAQKQVSVLRHQVLSAPSSFDVFPTSYTKDDRLDEAAVQINPEWRCGRLTCCAEGTFGSRFWRRIKLDHLLADNAPFYIFLKIALVTVLALLLDKGTRNPDSITSTFIGVLSLAAYLKIGKQMALNTLVSGLFGAVIGSLVNAACYLPPQDDPQNWMQLFSVTFSILLTVYAMYFAGKTDPGSYSSGVFSSLFVILVQFEYPPIAPYVPDDPRMLIWQTLLVRVLALLTAVISAFIVNFAVSASAPLAIYRMTLFFIERLVWRTQKHRLNPLEGRVQENFSRVLQMIHVSPAVKSAADSWIFSDSTRDEITLIEQRARIMFRFLTFRSFLELFVESCNIDDAELQAVTDMIEMSKRNLNGSSLRGLSLEDELDQIEALPDYLHVEKCVLKSILTDLHNNPIQWRPEGQIHPFFGRV